MQTCLLKTEENKSRQLTLVRMLSNGEPIMMLSEETHSTWSKRDLLKPSVGRARNGINSFNKHGKL